MVKIAPVRHTKWFYLAYWAVAESALGAALWIWAASSGPRREDEFGPALLGASWGTLLVVAMVIAAVAGALIMLTGTAPPIARWAVTIIAAMAAGTLSPIAMLFLIRPSLPAFLVAVAVVSMVVSGPGVVRVMLPTKAAARGGG